MKIDYGHPEFGVWHLAKTPIKTIPYGALIKWFDQVTQFGFHLGGGEIAWRDGVISAESLHTNPSLPWKRKTCVLGRNGRAVVFGEAAIRSEFQAGLYSSRQDFISACIGDDLATWGNFPVWIFDRFGKCFLHPVAHNAVYEKNTPGSKFMRIFGRKPFAMTENVAPFPLYYPETINPAGGEAMETLDTRFRHFQQHSKGDGSLQSVTFWGDKTKIQALTSFRYGRHEIYNEYMRINCEEKSYRERVLDRPDYNASEYDPTQWRIICCYEEIIKRVRQLHLAVEVFASTDSDLKQLVKPVPKFSITGSMWQEKMVEFREKEQSGTEDTQMFFFHSITCCKSLLPLYKYVRENGEFDLEIEALIFGFYRHDMAQYQKDTGKDGF